MIKSIISELSSILSSETYKEIMYAKDLDSYIKRVHQLRTAIEGATLVYTGYYRYNLKNLDSALFVLLHFLNAKAAKAKGEEKSCLSLTHYFSSFGDARKIKKTLKQLQFIALRFHSIKRTLEDPIETHTQTVSSGSLWANSRIWTEEVLGRDEERDKIVDMLLDDPISSQTRFVASIFGVAGVGKTTLAKYVYDDERVTRWFDVRIWVSTAQDFDAKKILLKIFPYGMPENCNTDQMDYDFLKQAIGGKKFLLVLDDIWDQEGLRQKWPQLRSFLALGIDNGSKVLVTTRRHIVVDCDEVFMLEELSRENSWLLFQKIAFTQFQEQGMKGIGKEIVEKCNVPLVIRIIGGLLSTKCTVNEWMAFRDDQLAKFSGYRCDSDDIMQTLILCCNQLDKRIKLCFAYCALFPKGYKYDKFEMIRLWISLGYIESSKRQRLEDTAEYCIRMLAIQGFVITDKKSSRYFVLHDLVHDLALHFADFNINVNQGIIVDECDYDYRLRHLSLVGQESKSKNSAKFRKDLLSLLVLDLQSWYNLYDSDRKFNRFPNLRILSLSNLGIKEVPSSLCELFSLRYLDLSHNPISYIPDSITQLVELLSLNVSFCTKLHEFPEGITKLVKLRHFINEKCSAPMPKRVATLADLQTLDELRLEISEWFPKGTDCGLAELNFIINHLMDGTTIKVNGDAISRSFKAKEEDWDNKRNHVCLGLYFEQDFQHNTNLIKLVIDGYKGERSPNFMKNGNQYFENLVEIRLVKLEGCRSLGSFGMLLHLKKLTCYQLRKVKYIEDSWCVCINPFAPLFPSLVELRLFEMPKLKSWFRVPEGESSSSSPVQVNIILLEQQIGFPQLQKLYVTEMEFVISMTREFRGFCSLEGLSISNCADFKAIPDGIPNLSNLKQFELRNCCDELKKRCQEPTGEDWPKIKHIPYVRTFI